ncbi:VOC family protein [Sodalis sp. dw_96]|uniref:VOC family protein n=1 Tax=Sodalis sp. dw_96 TaxID=2719794 RepID=UPI001BD2E390|nr:VOC family protein [Sodalis sp. dw_96]
MNLSLDHLVINSHFAVETTADIFCGLGFTLTPRGVHSLGSLNYLMMFPGHYLELVGLPTQGDKIRRELLDSPPGIDGLVFTSDGAEQTARQLSQAGFPLQPVQSFSREVVSGDARGVARFTTVRLAAGEFPAGRVYFCQHHTPEWVWRPEWLSHPNGVSAIDRLTLVAGDPQQQERHYRRLGHTDERFRLQIIHPTEFARRCGGLIQPPAERGSLFAAIRLRGGDGEHIARDAAAMGLPMRREGELLQVALPDLLTLLEFLP